MRTARGLMPAAAASAMVAGVFGYVARGAVNTDAPRHQLLVTHRNINTRRLIGGKFASTDRLKSRPSLATITRDRLK